MSTSPAPVRFGVVVPVKPFAVAKSRLSELGDDVRRDLVGAFAVDTVTAALDCPEVAAVLVVTDEVALAGSLRELGVAVIPDGLAGQLNGSLVQGAAELLRLHPGLRPVAICGDLPALRADELGEALALVGTHAAGTAAYVPDAAGIGTTLYTAPDLAGFDPRFGAASRAAHRAAGAVELPVPAGSSVRRDVDTPEDLDDALRLGVGARTNLVATLTGLG